MTTKEGFAILTGIPALILSSFYGIGVLIDKFVIKTPPPQYDFLFSISEFTIDKASILFAVVDNKLVVNYICNKYCNPLKSPDRVYLYRFDHQSQSVNKVSISLLSSFPNSTYNIRKNVVEFKDVKLDSNVKAPDGYIYQKGRRSRSRSAAMASILDYVPLPTISKNVNLVPIELPSWIKRAYKITFIGWIIHQ